MSHTTTTITSDEIEAVAAKIDADQPLDDRDRFVLRGLFLLAGEAASQIVADDEVEGFGLGADVPNDFGLSLNFSAPSLVESSKVHGSFSKGRRLLQACCTGEHIKNATLP